MLIVKLNFCIFRICYNLTLSLLLLYVWLLLLFLSLTYYYLTLLLFLSSLFEEIFLISFSELSRQNMKSNNKIMTSEESEY